MRSFEIQILPFALNLDTLYLYSYQFVQCFTRLLGVTAFSMTDFGIGIWFHVWYYNIMQAYVSF